VNSNPAEKPILFLPDLNPGAHVRWQTSRNNMKVWPVWARAAHPNTLAAAHPEWPPNVLEIADFITRGIIDWWATADAAAPDLNGARACADRAHAGR
jgi:quinolinate synthase